MSCANINLFLVEVQNSVTEGRKPLLLLPRTVPLNQTNDNEIASKNQSIFGSGKPRDVNKPEIKQLEERLEQTLTLSRQKTVSTSNDEDEKMNNSLNSASSSSVSQDRANRLRTTSTTSSNRSNRK